MKKLIIIGNGFDLGHKLRTSFDDFVGSSPIYSERYKIFKGADNKWCNVENRFKALVSRELENTQTEVNIEDITTSIVDEFGINEHGEVNYYDYESDAFKAEVQATAPIVYSLISFEADFQAYLQSHFNDEAVKTTCTPTKTLQELFNSATRAISFNYTNVPEQAYGFSAVEHIHGNINDNIIIGCDSFTRLDESLIYGDYPTSSLVGRPKDVLIERMRFYDHDLDGNLVEKEPIRRFFDSVQSKTERNENELHKILKLRSKEFLNQRQAIIKSLSEETYDEIHIIGHSLGEADWSVLNSLHGTKIICYYHDEDDRTAKAFCINKNNWHFLLEPDCLLFSN